MCASSPSFSTTGASFQQLRVFSLHCLLQRNKGFSGKLTALAMKVLSPHFFFHFPFHLLSSSSSCPKSCLCFFSLVFSRSFLLFSCLVSPLSSSLAFFSCLSFSVSRSLSSFSLYLSLRVMLVVLCCVVCVVVVVVCVWCVCVCVCVCCGTLKKRGKKTCVDSKTAPCVHSKRSHLYRHHAHMCFNMKVSKILRPLSSLASFRTRLKCTSTSFGPTVLPILQQEVIPQQRHNPSHVLLTVSVSFFLMLHFLSLLLSTKLHFSFRFDLSSSQSFHCSPMQ